MGRRGPIANPNGVRSLRGEFNRPTPGDATMRDLKCPDHLDKEGRAEWRRLVTMLSAPPAVLSARDGVALADLATCICRLRQAEAEVSRLGLVIQTERGPVRNPASLTAKEYRAAVQQWSAKFGLTPDARARMSLTAPQPEDDDEFGLLD